MHRLLRLLAIAAATAACLTYAAPCATAQDPGQDPAVELHEKARQRFQELHRRMQKLQSSKQATEPEESRLLQGGNRFIQEQRIHEGMDKARELLGSGDYDEALETMNAVGEDLTKLLEILLNRDLELEKLLERIKELEGFRDRVDDLLEQQKAEKDAAAEAEELMKHLEELEQAKAQVDKLLAAQSELREDANEAGMSAKPAEAKDMAAGEGELKKATDELAEKVKKIEANAKKIAEKDAEPAEGEGGAGSGKSGSGASGAAKSASKSMDDAQQDLGENQPERSLEDMDKAMSKLAETKEQLDKMSDEARRRLQQLPFDLQARKQEQTRVDTDRLAQDMENAEQGDDSGEGQPSPGKKNVQQAVPKQKAAAGQLKEKKPAEAKQDQQDAADDLEQAKQELEDALAQLRQQLEDEVLRALEERFAEMLARQKEISARTKAIDKVRETSLTAAGAIPAKVEKTCVELSNGELELSAEASDAIKLLEEDGRSAAFPIIVEEVRDDLDRVSDRLSHSKCATVTQDMQAEIELTLTDLIDALRKTIEERAGGT